METAKIKTAADIKNMSDEDFAKYYARLVFHEKSCLPSRGGLVRSALKSQGVDVNLYGPYEIGDELIESVFENDDDFRQALKNEHAEHIMSFVKNELAEHQRALYASLQLARQFKIEPMLNVIEAITDRLYGGDVDFDEVIEHKCIEQVRHNNDAAIYDD